MRPVWETPLEKHVRELGPPSAGYGFEYAMVPMRDGVRLATVVIRPEGPGTFSTVMLRTPYPTPSLPSFFPGVFEAGYAVVVQFERGCELSEGTFAFLSHTADDASDTLDWLEGRSWSNGRAMLFGCSSPAENQLVISARGHRVLRGGIAMDAAAGVGSLPGLGGSQGVFYRGGIPLLKLWTLWYSGMAALTGPRMTTALADAAGDGSGPSCAAPLRQYSRVDTTGKDDFTRSLERSLRMAPSAAVLERLAMPRGPYGSAISAGPTGEAWRDADLLTADHLGATPSISLNGWMDFGIYESVKRFEFQQHHPDQYLVVAAAGHCGATTTSTDAYLGDRPVGDTTFDYNELFLAWFAKFLTDGSDWTPQPRVRVYVIGAGTWLTGETWPLPETVVSALHLGSDGDARSLWGRGRLTAQPIAGAASDEVVSDPRNPVPSLGGPYALVGTVCADQSPVECRSDVLVYTSEPLTEPRTIAGDVEAVLHVSADVADADVFVKIIEVLPDGTAYNVAESGLRLRYRDGHDAPAALEPGRVYEVRVVGMVTATRFAAGHRIRVEIAGSSFPTFDRNWQTGGVNESETEGPVARLTIHHDADHPSRIEFREYPGDLREREPAHA